MKSIMDMEQEQRDALLFWIKDMGGKDPIIIIDMEGLFMDIPQETRRESYEAAKQDAATRRRVILEILTENGGMTAREVSAELHRRGITPSDERNYAAPRLTELYKAGNVICTSKRQCPLTKRYVAVWTARKE